MQVIRKLDHLGKPLFNEIRPPVSGKRGEGLAFPSHFLRDSQRDQAGDDKRMQFCAAGRPLPHGAAVNGLSLSADILADDPE